MLKGFEEFNKKECINSNINVVGWFILILVGCIVLDIAIFKISQPYMRRLDNMFADLIAVVMFLFITLVVLIIYSFIVTLKVKLYEGILNNLKLFIGLMICNGIVAVVLSVITTGTLAFGYIVTVAVVCSASFSIRYSLVKKNG